MITLREGIEGFLIVAITLAYLRKTGRAYLSTAVYAGVGVALLASWAASVVFARAENQPLWEGILALVTAGLVATFTVHVLRSARFLKRAIEGRLEQAAAQRGAWAFVGVFAFTVLMITREGMEAALLLSSTFIQTETRPFFVGALLGLAVAAVLAVLWGRYGHRVNLPRFLQVTAVFLLLFVVQLLIYGFHELTESGVLPIDNGYWHLVTEPYGPEGPYGQWLSYALVLIPLGWLVWTTVRRPAPAAGSVSAAR